MNLKQNIDLNTLYLEVIHSVQQIMQDFVKHDGYVQFFLGFRMFTFFHGICFQCSIQDLMSFESQKHGQLGQKHGLIAQGNSGGI